MVFQTVQLSQEEKQTPVKVVSAILKLTKRVLVLEEWVVQLHWIDATSPSLWSEALADLNEKTKVEGQDSLRSS